MNLKEGPYARAYAPPHYISKSEKVFTKSKRSIGRILSFVVTGRRGKSRTLTLAPSGILGTGSIVPRASEGRRGISVRRRRLLRTSFPAAATRENDKRGGGFILRRRGCCLGELWLRRENAPRSLRRITPSSESVWMRPGSANRGIGRFGPTINPAIRWPTTTGWRIF